MGTDEIEDSTTGCALAALGLVLLFPAMLLWAWVSVTLWRWFVMPIFPVAAIGMVQALGLSLAVKCFTGYGQSPVRTNAKTNKELIADIVTMFAHPMFILAVAALVKLVIT